MRVWDVAPFIKNKVPCPLCSLWGTFSKKLKNNGDGRGGSNQKKQALSLLAAGSPLEKVADSIGVHRATLWRWKKDPKFVAEWNKMLEEMKQRQTYALVKLQEEAISALYSCLNSKNDVVRLRAALSVMERVDNLKVGCTDPEVIQQEKEQNQRLQQMWDF